MASIQTTLIPPSSRFAFQSTIKQVGSILSTGAKNFFTGASGKVAKDAVKVGGGLGIGGVLTGIGLSNVSQGIDSLSETTGIPSDLIFIGLGILVLFILIMVVKR